MAKVVDMSPVSPVFHTVVRVSIGLKKLTLLRDVMHALKKHLGLFIWDKYFKRKMDNCSLCERDKKRKEWRNMARAEPLDGEGSPPH